jgi:allophanate hydrolase
MTIELDITRLHAAYAGGLSAEQVVREVYERIAAADDPGIFISLVEERAAIDAARALPDFDPEASPLWGVPFAVKDNIDVAGMPTTAACPGYAYRPQASATVVQRLLAAGAILVGKTNLDQFATGLVGVRSPYPPPRNSFDPAIVPGGSSSGSAIAVARGLVSFALGTDTAGSGRVPAALNNIVGLKPTVGAAPITGVVPACKSLDCVSVFALTVDDAHAACRAMTGYDAADPFSRAVPMPAIGAFPPALRIGIPRAADLFFDGDEASATAWAAAVDVYRGLGATLVEIDLTPFFETARLLYEGSYVAERYAAIRPFIEARPEALFPVTRAIITGATRYFAADAYATFYRLKELQRATASTWTTIDALLVPSLPRPYSLAELEGDPIGPNSNLGTYTNFVNLLDLCALAVPGPLRGDGFPAGATLIAPGGRDGFLAAIGRAAHAASGLTLGATGRQQPPLAAAPAMDGPGEIELCVVGAHLSGMALNHELLALGARLLRAVETAPHYRLHALAGGPPRRPGLLRVEEGGAGIQTEVWALSPEAFGRFVAGIPAPLGIGTLRLADGTTPKGFLVEPAALDGALDITAFGGWRAFLDIGPSKQSSNDRSGSTASSV